jgi:NitT/TauT family transport system ATP-binding protein
MTSMDTSANSDPVLLAENVSKSFTTAGRRTVNALSRIDLSIGESEFVALIGPSGCGKTTLLNLMAGLDRPDTGTLLLRGSPITGPSPRQAIIFQQFALFPWMTVAKNIESGLRFTHVPKNVRRQRVADLLKVVGLSEFATAYPKELSGGMKQRVAIARAYALQPEVLLMDEPFAALDAHTRTILQQDLLDTWTRERTTVVFVTHDVDEAVFLASRVVVMARNPGRIYKHIPVDLPYPRSQSLRTSSEFFQLRNRVWNTVYGLGGSAR